MFPKLKVYLLEMILLDRSPYDPSLWFHHSLCILIQSSFPCFSSEMHVKALTETYCLTEFLIFNILVKNYIFCSIWSTNCRLSTTNWKILAIVRTTLYTADCRLDTISYVSYNLRSRSWMFHKLGTFSKEDGKYYFIFAYTTHQ